MGVNNWGLYYNKDILEAAGWDPESPPTTHDELVECATKCQSDEIWGFPVPYTGDTTYIFSTLMSMGGMWIKDGKVGLDDPEPADSSRWLLSFVENGLAPEGGGDLGGLFQAGKSAMYLGGPWMTGGFTAAGLNYAVTEWVQGKVKGTQGGALGYSIFNKSPHADQCWEFMKWWQGDEVQIPWCECSGYPSANPKLADHPRIIGNELIYPFQLQALYAEAPAPGVIPHAEVSRIFRETFEATMYGEDPAAAWAAAAEETRNVLREAGQLAE
jgi:multiple sugar transport system substrate-binding protein